MKTPITQDEARPGDTIRAEWDGNDTNTKAKEYVFRSVGDWHPHADRNYLLDRPTPPVELPTGVTIGRLTWRDGDGEKSLTTIWRPEVYDGHKTWMVSVEPDESVRGSDVITWVPMVAVPKTALDELRDGWASWGGIAPPLVRDFLTAVDEAHGDRR